MTSSPAATLDEQLPFPAAGVLDPAPRYAELRARAPIVRVRTPTGDPAWLVLRHDEARALFADPRLGRSHWDPENAPRLSTAALNGGPTWDFATEDVDHARFRRLLGPSFSARRMRLLAGRVAGLADGCVDALVAAREHSPDGVVDLREHVSFPLPLLVICELLGVPYDERDRFVQISESVGDLTGGPDAFAAFGELMAYIGELAAGKRGTPGEDVLSDLVAAQAADPAFDDAELARVAAGLLFAGHETTAVEIDLGVLTLLTAPTRRDAFVAGLPGTVAPTVEEFLRTLSSATYGLLRYAREDVVVGDLRIAAGDAVVLCASVANRDPAVHADPERFDPTRRPNVHLGFGHGPMYCLGASLARTELTTVFETLFTRLPGLRLGADPDRLRIRDDRVTGGVWELPVTW